MRPTDRSFTLLELVLVIAVLAVVAGTVISNIGDAEARAHDDLALAELAAVRDAVRRFRADTGFLPKSGPFALALDRDGDGDLDGAVPVPSEGTAWFDSPANLGQLFECPLPPTHPLADRRRGWNGPYLSRGAEGWVVVGDNLAPDGIGDPAAAPLLPPMPGVADPHLAEPAASGAFRWWPWGADTADVSAALLRHGRPILLLLGPDESSARVVGLGRDGVYTEHTIQDAFDPPAGGDDVGLFVLR